MNPGDDILAAGSGDYERPANRYRCGRGALWRPPCHQGPAPDGQCGGVAECKPVLQNGKFQCRRPRSAGGPCAEGPAPDGACAQRHPPCIPRLTLRARRGRLTWQLCGVGLLLLAAGFHFGTKGTSKSLSANPGPLSAKHDHFTRGQACAACHAAHDTGIPGLAKAVFAREDMNAKCSACHTFDGPADRPHNETFLAHDGPKQTDCRMCHTEHRGPNANLTGIADAQCHTCHKAKFTSFSQDHPAFANVPRVAHAAVKFNHAKHLLDYFKQPAFADRGQQRCEECHTASAAERTVRTAGFDAACARCHADQIAASELVLLRLPDLTAPADLAKLTMDDATPFMAWVVQGKATNTAEYGPNLAGWFRALTNGGASALARSFPTPDDVSLSAGTNLFQGLSPDLMQRPFALWLDQKKFEPAPGPVVSGWYWMEDLYPELRYKPTGHGDPVAKAWVDFALNASTPQYGGDIKRAAKLTDETTHTSTGVGRCLKCHVSTIERNDVRRIEWQYQPLDEPAHTKFSHGAHIRLMNCADCHVLNPTADYTAQFIRWSLASTPGVSNFKPMSVANCSSCHAERKVRADCFLCHEYHRSSLLNGTALLP